jgi:methionyl-tRNA formyltransferase
MADKRILFFSDNVAIMDGLVAFAASQPWGSRVDLACSPNGPLAGREGVRAMRLREELPSPERYELVVSGHCKQIFPAALVESIRCVNLHPGFNPETRGWYPQVFAILHGRRIGFTVHLMDAEIDHGAILYREEVEAHPWDTSRSLYERVVAAEIESLPRWLPDLAAGRISSFLPEGEGHYASRQDFRDLCEIDLERTGTFREFLDLLRATSFPPHRNAFVVDPKTGRKLFVRVELEPDAQAGEGEASG